MAPTSPFCWCLLSAINWLNGCQAINRGHLPHTHCSWQLKKQARSLILGPRQALFGPGALSESAELARTQQRTNRREYPIGYNIPNWICQISNWCYFIQLKIVICSLTLRYQTHISQIPNWIYYPQLRICYSQLGIICPIWDIFC